VILQRVFFAVNDDVVLAESFPLLGQVAAVLQDHAEIERVRVEGHTDAVGERGWNLDLSQRRARAVLKLLVAEGVDAGRLEAVGYGFDRPVASNEVEDGRAKNRRVEFTIVR
jgi:outer membrane protein OmpA-like peptidoglycan-associated protein